MVQRIARFISASLALGFIGMPIAFLFAAPAALPTSGPLNGLYSAGVQLFGELTFRLGFCLVWLGANAAFVWRFWLSRRRHDLAPVDGLCDYD